MASAQKVLARLSVFDGSDLGSIEVGEDKIILDLDKVTTIRQGYVSAVNKTADLALKKVGVELMYFDLFGNQDVKRFAMHENDYRTLKKVLGK